MINYKYNEPELLKEFAEYVDKTYGEHYSQDKFQATEFIIDGGHGEGFCIGNIIKYAFSNTVSYEFVDTSKSQ